MTYFADLTSRQVAALPDGDRVPVLLLPVGAVEPHGPHAPLGTDPLISRGMCERAAERLAADEDVHVLVLPEIPYGVTRFATGFAGGVHIGEETLHSLLVDIGAALIGQRFRRILLVNNHFEPAHLVTLRRAVETLNFAYDGRAALLDLVRRRHAQRLTEEFRSGECHAGRYETSLVLADRPELVDQAVMRTLPHVPISLTAARSASVEGGGGGMDGLASAPSDGGFLAMGMSEAYCGKPAEATAEEGAETFSTLTDLLVEAIRELARE
ncbi:creatininase family protein [Amycolatopsis sp. SID8362]|uniref:creatininase family protein n=1 Tax=Amycolatopsis sp. SID8362 TaxID=2690346 RepID=UPI001367F53A|nr:creatininase family protein [Amycolatopsis sp. SID8362]NBH08706.1 creatininase family protein [Amycolatopsis sp. SID8362]NED45400.1 creatininase family protein [Amycolatopsis sp. SID8362]